MATRRDFILVSQALRTTPMHATEREALAEALGDGFAAMAPDFNRAKFIHECVRGPRSGERPTPVLDSALPDDALVTEFGFDRLDLHGVIQTLGDLYDAGEEILSNKQIQLARRAVELTDDDEEGE